LEELLIFVPFFLLVILGTLAVVNASRNERKKMLAKAAATGARNVVFATHVDGLGIGYGTNCDLYLFDNQIVIVPKIGVKFVLDLSKIRAAEYKTERELIEKSKSVVGGGAMIGTLLVPGLGTIVGGMSGIGTKKKKGALNCYMILNYENSSGELAGVTFLNNLNVRELSRFVDDINLLLTTQNRVISL